MNQKNFQLKDGKVQPFRVEKPIKKLQNFNYSLVAINGGVISHQKTNVPICQAINQRVTS